MLDRTIPYYNLILRCDRYGGGPIRLPEGFSFRAYRPGDERAWARLETAVGDFDTLAAAEAYFRETYLQDPEKRAALAERSVFLTDGRGAVAGACIAWRDRRGGETVASLHWLVVSPEYQGRGLGRALCQKTMEVYCLLGELPVYLHTQPWSWKAVLLYVSLGFSIQRTDTFKDYENQYLPAMETLRALLTDRDYGLLEAASRG